MAKVLGIGSREPVTYHYPENPRPVAVRFRGIVGMRRDEVTDLLSCVGCGLCETACPYEVIHIDTSQAEDGTRWVERYEFDLGRCIYCYLCIEACPVDALQVTHAYHTLTPDRSELVISSDEMMEMWESQDRFLFERHWNE